LTIRKELEGIAWRTYGAILIFCKNPPCDEGTLADFSGGIITIYPYKSARKMVSAFCHELAHAYCYRTELYPEYHGLTTPCIKKRGNKQYKFFPKEVFKIEQFVDRTGHQFYNDMGFRKRFGQYDKHYKDEDYESYFKEHLRKRYEIIS